VTEMKQEEDISMMKRLLRWIFTDTYAPKPPLPAKDPLDFTLTKSSTQWLTEDACPHCKAMIEHRECMAHICNSCGGRWNWEPLRRVYRQIWSGERWVYQCKYSDAYYHIYDTHPPLGGLGRPPVLQFPVRNDAPVNLHEAFHKYKR